MWILEGNESVSTYFPLLWKQYQEYATVSDTSFYQDQMNFFSKDINPAPSTPVKCKSCSS